MVRRNKTLNPGSSHRQSSSTPCRKVRAVQQQLGMLWVRRRWNWESWNPRRLQNRVWFLRRITRPFGSLCRLRSTPSRPVSTILLVNTRRPALRSVCLWYYVRPQMLLFCNSSSSCGPWCPPACLYIILLHYFCTSFCCNDPSESCTKFACALAIQNITKQQKAIQLSY